MNLSDICLPIENGDSERFLLKSFYHHKLFISSADFTKDCPYSEYDLSKELLRLLLKYPCKDLMEIILEDRELFPIGKKDVPQFSDLRKAFYNVPYILMNCGIDGVGYAQMGYILREKQRSDVADKKYGENHIKTAEQLGLCYVKGYKSYLTDLGKISVSLPEKEKELLLPRLCLYIPFIQNYFLSGQDDEFLNKQFSILSPSTIGRRRPNVNTLIRIINKAIEDGI